MSKTKHSFIINVTAPDEFSRAKVGRILNAMLDIAYADAQSTLECDYSDSNASDVVRMDFSKPKALTSNSIRGITKP